MENAKALGIKLLTWYCNRRQDHPDVCRGTSKLDASEDCMRWDCSVEPLVKVAFQQCKADLASIWPAYWQKWDNVHLPALEASSAKLTRNESHLSWYRKWWSMSAGISRGADGKTS